MTREKEINVTASKYIEDNSMPDGEVAISDHKCSFIEGSDWADANPKSPWIKFTEKFPPQQEPIIIAMKNKNKEDGIWLYDLCKFFSGDYTDNNNWEDKVNWEIPIYWMPIPNLPKE